MKVEKEVFSYQQQFLGTSDYQNSDAKINDNECFLQIGLHK